MCSYQRVNNSYGCQNSKLLNGILKEELGFEGFVVCAIPTFTKTSLITYRYLIGTHNMLVLLQRMQALT